MPVIGKGERQLESTGRVVVKKPIERLLDTVVVPIEPGRPALRIRPSQMRLGGPNLLDDRLEIGFHWGHRHIAIVLCGGRNRSRTCDLFLVMEALVPTELCARVTHGIISWHGKRLKRSPRTFRAARVGRRGPRAIRPSNAREYIVGWETRHTLQP